MFRRMATPPLLLYSLAEFRDLMRACLDVTGARAVVEIGSETGAASVDLYSFLRERGGELWCVEPEPAPEIEQLDAAEARFHLVQGRSPQALDGLGPADAWVIDGDHNYWTVLRELEYADRTAREARSPTLLFLHDVSWPCGRRDHYYAPDALPDGAMHPHSFELGQVPGVEEAVEGGFRGRGSFAIALREGGPRNGVLTAIEDFLDGREDLRLVHVPVIFGVGVVFDLTAPYASRLEELLAPYDGNPLLARLEQNRLDLYLKVVELQDAIAARGLQQNRLVVEYDVSLAAAEAEAARLRLEVAKLQEAARVRETGSVTASS
jgi:Methyltransferase domain